MDRPLLISTKQYEETSNADLINHKLDLNAIFDDLVNLQDITADIDINDLLKLSLEDIKKMHSRRSTPVELPNRSEAMRKRISRKKSFKVAKPTHNKWISGYISPLIREFPTSLQRLHDYDPPEWESSALLDLIPLQSPSSSDI